ncbi:MAG: metal ABC transporter ATP-binding protein [Lentisphaeria bacterium]|nr:metal ABC transporter ATP-binding protein [Lentisphaeria bacterium]NQZ67645.1 metal ABC transporter ATP-binding protein [Lentisphaeria bacterium]
MNPIINIENLQFSYDVNEPVLRNANLKMEANSFMSVIGPNGGGKSTLLKLILGLLTPQGGEISVLDKSPAKAARDIGYVPQNTNINKNFPIQVLDVVISGAMSPWQMSPAKEDVEKAHDLLKKLEIDQFAKRRIGELSGGQRQRVMIARALVSDPELLLLDEPTANIDAHGEHTLFELLESMTEERGVVMVSHDVGIVLQMTDATVACVNKDIHLHKTSEISREVIEEIYGHPINMLAHHHHDCGEEH